MAQTVFSYILHQDGKIDDTAFELISAAKKIAQEKKEEEKIKSKVRDCKVFRASVTWLPQMATWQGQMKHALEQGAVVAQGPLAELTKLNKDDVQRHPEIAKLYSQSSGLAAFLIDGDEGRYREPLVLYLKAIYAGRDDAQSLAEATGASYDELDAAYRRYVESLP